MSKEIIEAKQQVVSEIAESFKAAQSSIVVEYHGITVNQSSF